MFLVALGIAYVLQSKKLYRLEQDLRRALIQLKSESKKTARGTRQIFENLDNAQPESVRAPLPHQTQSEPVTSPDLESKAEPQHDFQAHFERSAGPVEAIEKEPLQREALQQEPVQQDLNHQATAQENQGGRELIQNGLRQKAVSQTTRGYSSAGSEVRSDMSSKAVPAERTSTLAERSASDIVERDFDQNLSLSAASKYTLARNLIAKGYSTAEVAQKSGLSQAELSLLGKLPRDRSRLEKNF